VLQYYNLAWVNKLVSVECYLSLRLSETRLTVGNLIVLLCQNLGASNRTPVPVQQQTRLETLWTGVKECRKRIVRETTEGHASFVSRLNSIGLLLVIINL
jgi:hypothetical protein